MAVKLKSSTPLSRPRSCEFIVGPMGIFGHLNRDDHQSRPWGTSYHSGKYGSNGICSREFHRGFLSTAFSGKGHAGLKFWLLARVNNARVDGKLGWRGGNRSRICFHDEFQAGMHREDALPTVIAFL
jgi:hypothetical protein